MAKGQLLKKRDSDLTSSNVKPGVDIFGVTGGYGGLTGGTYPLGMAYSANENDIYDERYGVNDIRYYESGGIIYCMGCVTCLTEGGLPGRSFYYLEIDKDSLQVIKRSNYQRYSPEVYSNNTGTYMSIQNISGVDRFCFCCNTLSTSRGLRVYFNGTSLVEGGSTGTSIGDTYLDAFNGYSIDQLVGGFSSYNIASTTYFSSWFGQTFNSGIGGNLGAIKVRLRTDGVSLVGNIYCELYTGTFSTLVGTADIIPHESLGGGFNWHRFDFSGITLSPSTAYSFKVYYSGADSFSRVTYEANTSNLYPSGNMYRTGSSFSGVDVVFRIIVGDLIGTFTGSSTTRNEQDSYNDYSCAVGFLNFN